MPESDFWPEFERKGVENVRALMVEWVGAPKIAAIAWLAQKDEEARLKADAGRAEELAIAASARDAAFEANSLAALANDVAREANSIAREAAASAARSAEAARTNNMIATLAMIAAVIAIGISVIGLFLKK